jgi:sulfur carrier protein ThiS
MNSAELHPKGMLKQYINDKNIVEVPSGITLRDAISSCGIPPELVAMAFIDQKPISKDVILQPGEIIDLVAVVGGGST